MKTPMAYSNGKLLAEPKQLQASTTGEIHQICELTTKNLKKYSKFHQK